jgi:inorganic pyrophosphatase
MPLLHGIDPGPECPEIVRMIVEIPKGSGNKYEYDRALGVFRLDRALGTRPGLLSLFAVHGKRQ